MWVTDKAEKFWYTHVNTHLLSTTSRVFIFYACIFSPEEFFIESRVSEMGSWKCEPELETSWTAKMGIPGLN